MLVKSNIASFMVASLVLAATGQTASDAPIAMRSWDQATELANSFIAKLTVKEKAQLVTGTPSGGCDGNIAPIPRLDFNGLCLLDGPTAVRNGDLASLFPAGITTGATWDKNLMYARAVALGEEFRGKGGNIQLGPVCGPLGKFPLGGRNWEGFSVDPYLAGIAISQTVTGTQDAGVMVTTKHLIGNEQEFHRQPVGTSATDITAAISANIPGRTLHELYLWPFANSVKAGTASVMCSYNRFNYTYACESDELLNGILKGELGFTGFVMSDFGAIHSGVKSIEAGLDMDMPGLIGYGAPATGPGASFFGDNVWLAVENGTLNESRVDDMVRRIMTPYYSLNQDAGFPTVDPSQPYVYNSSTGQPLAGKPPPARDVRGDHTALVREIAAAGTVLLKNTDSILPLSGQNFTTIAVFSNDAADETDGLYFLGFGYPPAPPVHGTLVVGGGSGAGRAVDVVSPLRAIRDRGIKDGFRTEYITNNVLLAGNFFVPIYPPPDVCIVFAKTFATEGGDRTSFSSDQDADVIVENVASFCPPGKTIVVTHSAGINTMPWAKNDNVAAILAAHYPGEQSGNSIVDILWGDVNPSGRLPYTIPEKESDYPFPVINITGPDAGNSDAWVDSFDEGLLIDYRYFDANDVTPLYEFGFGLSYTEFNMSSTLLLNKIGGNGKFSALPAQTNMTSPGGNPELWETVLNVTATVSNVGGMAGAAVPQLYISFPNATVPQGTPIRVLRGFDKVSLAPGESADVIFPLMRRDVSYWSVDDEEWRIPAGSFKLSAGYSSRKFSSFVDVTLV